MPAVAIKYERELLLWDCGEGTQRQLMKYKVGFGSIDAIFITHPHLDHYLGMYGLLETLNMSSPSPKQVRLFLPRKLDASRYDFAQRSNMRKGTLYKGNGFSVSAFPVKHCTGSYGLIFQEDDQLKFDEKKAHSLGMRGRQFTQIQKSGKVKTQKGTVSLEEVTWIKVGRKVVYSGDGIPDENTLEAAADADLLIHEGTFDSSMKDEAAERLHSTVADAARIAKEAKVKQLVITHISPRYADPLILEREARKIFKGASIAKDGMSIDL
jgi:ribonuclease Z